MCNAALQKWWYLYDKGKRGYLCMCMLEITLALSVYIFEYLFISWHGMAGMPCDTLFSREKETRLRQSQGDGKITSLNIFVIDSVASHLG